MLASLTSEASKQKELAAYVYPMTLEIRTPRKKSSFWIFLSRIVTQFIKEVGTINNAPLTPKETLR
jgi:hypothetical protein